MFAKIKAFFDSQLANDETGISEEKHHLACAALLIEVAIIDQELDGREMETVKKILLDQFSISPTDYDSLVALAQQEAEDSTSTYQFTRLVNDQCSHQEKFSLVCGMWQVAYADGELDKYEEYIIRKVSELIHVSHGDFIRAKHEAKKLAFPS